MIRIVLEWPEVLAAGISVGIWLFVYWKTRR